MGSNAGGSFGRSTQVIPHPIYAKQRWIAILSPSRRTLEDLVKPLIAEARDRLPTPRRGAPAG